MRPTLNAVLILRLCVLGCVVSLAAGCVAHRLAKQQRTVRKELLRNYDEQFVGNLGRAARGLPILHYKYGKVTNSAGATYSAEARYNDNDTIVINTDDDDDSTDTDNDEYTVGSSLSLTGSLSVEVTPVEDRKVIDAYRAAATKWRAGSCSKPACSEAECCTERCAGTTCTHTDRWLFVGLKEAPHPENVVMSGYFKSVNGLGVRESVPVWLAARTECQRDKLRAELAELADATMYAKPKPSTPAPLKFGRSGILFIGGKERLEANAGGTLRALSIEGRVFDPRFEVGRFVAKGLKDAEGKALGDVTIEVLPASGDPGRIFLLCDKSGVRLEQLANTKQEIEYRRQDDPPVGDPIDLHAILKKLAE